MKCCAAKAKHLWCHCWLKMSNKLRIGHCLALSGLVNIYWRRTQKRESRLCATYSSSMLWWSLKYCATEISCGPSWNLVERHKTVTFGNARMRLYRLKQAYCLSLWLALCVFAHLYLRSTRSLICGRHSAKNLDGNDIHRPDCECSASTSVQAHDDLNTLGWFRSHLSHKYGGASRLGKKTLCLALHSHGNVLKIPQSQIVHR